jgi:arylsulfatase A-like enzyme/tetratricopeptide (TPR) repeat protein
MARTVVYFAVVAALLLAVPGAHPAGQTRVPRRPNILLVTIDTLRADRVGAYGAKSPATPAMDRLAAEGCLFEESIVQVPLTRPSHATIFTGLYPFQHGIRDNFAPPLGIAHRTLAEILKGQGYATGGFVGSFIVNTQSGLNRGFDEFDDTFETGGKGSAFFTEYQRRAAQVEERAGPWIERAAAGSRPFFAWVHFYDPHSPYKAPPPYGARYAKTPYDGEVAYTDDVLGRLMARLVKLGVADRTLVVVTSDHGESLGEHKEEEHGFFVYDVALRVPLILRMPGRIAGGVRVKTVARSIDLVPTILDLAGLRTATPQGLPGHSLAAALGAPQKADPEIISYSETLFARLHFGWSELRSVRMGGWKYIQAPRPELYDLARDPAEQNNVYSSEGRRAAAMRSRLLDTLGGSPETAVVGVANPVLDQETMDRLASLGYISGPGGGAPSNVDPKDKIEDFMEYGRAIRTAVEAFGSGNLKAAVKGLEAIVAQGRGGFDVSFYLGRAYLELRDFQAAVPHLRDAILKVPTYTPAYLELAKALVALKQYDEAMRVLRDGLARDPRNFQFHSHLGFIARARQDLPTARRHYETSRSLEPGDFDVRMNLGAIYRDLGEPRLALQEVDAALQIQPNSGEAHNQRGMLLGGLGDLPAAVGAFERATTLEPKNALMWFNLGLTRLRAGDKAGAAAALRRTLDLKPDFTEAKKLLAETGR